MHSRNRKREWQNRSSVKWKQKIERILCIWNQYCFDTFPPIFRTNSSRICMSTPSKPRFIVRSYVGLNDSHFLECAFNLISSLEYNTFFLKLVSHMSQRHVTEQRIVFDSNYTKNWRGLLYLRSGTVFQVSIVPHSVRWMHPLQKRPERSRNSMSLILSCVIQTISISRTAISIQVLFFVYKGDQALSCI